MNPDYPDSDYPVRDRLFVLKDGESRGPFEIGEILDLLDAGDLDYEDVCLREGAADTERLRDVLDWEGRQPVATEEPADADTKDGDPRESPDGSDREAPSPFPPGGILYRGHPSVLAQPLTLLGLVGGVVAGAWIYSTDSRLMLLCVLISIFSLARLTLVRFTHDYFISPRRIELVTGLVAKNSREVRISDIRAINVTCSGLVGVLGVGTVDFFTSGDDPEVSFERIWAASRVKKLVRRLQDESA